MKSSLLPAFENLDKALGSLETVVDERLCLSEKKATEPELNLDARNERDVNRKVAAKLDKTISRLETLLTVEQ